MNFAKLAAGLADTVEVTARKPAAQQGDQKAKKRRNKSFRPGGKPMFDEDSTKQGEAAAAARAAKAAAKHSGVFTATGKLKGGSSGLRARFLAVPGQADIYVPARLVNASGMAGWKAGTKVRVSYKETKRGCCAVSVE